MGVALGDAVGVALGEAVGVALGVADGAALGDVLSRENGNMRRVCSLNCLDQLAGHKTLTWVQAWDL